MRSSFLFLFLALALIPAVPFGAQASQPTCTDQDVIALVCQRGGPEQPDALDDTGYGKRLSDFANYLGLLSSRATTVSAEGYQRFERSFHNVTKAYATLFDQMKGADALYFKIRLSTLKMPTPDELETYRVTSLF
jgi:hypothetical protein